MGRFELPFHPAAHSTTPLAETYKVAALKGLTKI